MTEPAASAEDPAMTEAVPLSRRRRLAIWALIVVASLIVLVSILTTWVNRQLLDNAQFSKASTKMIQDPEIRNTLSVYLVNQVYDNVDVAAALAQQLPDNLQPLAGPISSALREPATKSVNFLLARPRFQQTWIDSSTVAHDKLVNVLENKTGSGISTGDGVVTLDLNTLAKQLGQQVGLPASALSKLPPNAGVITIMRSDQLSAAQAAVQTVKVLSVWLLVIVLFLFGLAIYLARGFRRETLRNVGWAFVLTGVIILVVRRLGGNYAINALAPSTYRETFHRVWLINSTILGEIGRAVVLYGLVGVLGAVLAGPTRAATSARRWLAPYLNDRQGIVWGVVGGVYLLLVLWGPTHALRVWWGILLLAALISLGVVAFRRQTLQEFPAASGEAATDAAPIRA
jgi:uncharacterized membrane protein